MENQHRKITGYRELSADEIATMNAIKAQAELVGELIGKIHSLNSERFGASALRPSRTAEDAIQTAESNRWVAIARTQLQQGFMALTRAVALPTSF